MKKRPPTFVIIFSIIWAIIFFPVSMTIPNIAQGRDPASARS